MTGAAEQAIAAPAVADHLRAIRERIAAAARRSAARPQR